MTLPDEIREAMQRFIAAAGPSWHTSIDWEQVELLESAITRALDAAHRERDALRAAARAYVNAARAETHARLLGLSYTTTPCVDARRALLSLLDGGE